jgi:mono/diheme cytochrome c family protein
MRARWPVVLTLLALALAFAVVGCGAREPIVAVPAPPPETEEITMELSVSHVPHGARTCGTDCVGCHSTGRDGAPPQAHPERTECLLCHLVVDPSDL